MHDLTIAEVTYFEKKRFFSVKYFDCNRILLKHSVHGLLSFVDMNVVKTTIPVRDNIFWYLLLASSGGPSLRHLNLTLFTVRLET